MKPAELHKSLSKKYGDIFHDAKALQENTGQVIPVTLSMDIALNGGWLEGSIGTVSGNSGSGKTTLCLTIAANAQKLGKKIYYFDIENKLQYKLLETIYGLDLTPDKFQIVKSSEGNFITAEKHLNLINEIISTQKDVFIIIDSIAAFCPDVLFSAEHGESKKMMAMPSLMYDFLRKASQIVHGMRSTIIGISHIQANPSPYGGPTEVGGNAWKYFSLFRITCLSSKETPETGDKKTGRESKFKIYKTALGPGTGEGYFYIRYNHGYDREIDVLNLAEELGVVSKAGAWYEYKGQKYQGKAGFVEVLRNEPKLCNELDEAVRELVFVKKT